MVAKPVVNFPINKGDMGRAAALKKSATLSRTPASRGVFADFPAATPKWVGRGGPAEDDFRNTMARMFIELDAGELSKFLASVEASAPDSATGESRILAAVLTGDKNPKKGIGYIDFLLQDVQLPFQEKSQIVETLADNYVVYYFGQAAVPFTFAGTVLNTVEDDQAVNMLRMYRDILRGTQLARRRKLLKIRFNGMIVSGSVTGLTLNMSAESEMALAFSMQVLPKTVTLLPNKVFGVELLTDPHGDPVYAEPVQDARVPTAARLTVPESTNVAGSGGTAAEDRDEEDEFLQLYLNPNSGSLLSGSEGLAAGAEVPRDVYVSGSLLRLDTDRYVEGSTSRYLRTIAAETEEQQLAAQGAPVAATARIFGEPDDNFDETVAPARSDVAATTAPTTTGWVIEPHY